MRRLQWQMIRRTGLKIERLFLWGGAKGELSETENRPGKCGQVDWLGMIGPPSSRGGFSLLPVGWLK